MVFRYLLLALAVGLAARPALAQADLAVTAFSAEPDQVPVGESFVASYTLCNVGLAEAPASQLGFFLSADDVYDPLEDRLIGETTVPALGGGLCTEGTLDVVVPVDVDPGEYTLFAAADYDEALAEPDEDNNVFGVPFTVEGVLVPPVDVNLAPRDPPVVIPAGGGSFTFDVAVANVSPDPQTFDVWAEGERPNGEVFGPLFGPVRLTLQPGQGRGPLTLRQRVPARIPPGVYLFRVVAGTYPGQTIDAESFEVEKLGTTEAAPPSPAVAWPAAELLTDPTAAASAAPEAPALAVPRPNPFTDRTVLGFDVPAAAPVRLAVYDVQGREVAVLVDRTVEAGHHEAELEAGALPAGVYLVRLQVGGDLHTRSLTLVR